jgi:hypothetical protein
VDVDALAAALGRATAEDPAGRPGSALAFAAELRGAVHDTAAFEAARIPATAAATLAAPALGEPPEQSWADGVTASRLSIEPETSASAADTHPVPEPAPEKQMAAAGPSLFDVEETASRAEREDLELHAAPVSDAHSWENQPVRTGAAESPRRSPAPAAGARSRRSGGLSWQVIAVLLVLGVTAGFGGAYMLLGRSNAESTASTHVAARADAGAATPSSGSPAVTAAAPPPAAAGPGATAPREFTDNTVPEPPAITSAPSEGASPEAKEKSPGAKGNRTPPEPAEQPAAGRRAAAAAPAAGRLTVQSRPSGATVTVNGRERGETPLTLEHLTYRAYDLRLARSGYQTERRRVTLTAGRRTASLDVPMRRTRPPAQEERSAAPPPAPRSASGQFVGAVLVESRPSGASVFIDGERAGTTPLSIAEVPAGSHVVRIDLPGHSRWSSAVRVVAGQRVRVAASLEEETVR